MITANFTNLMVLGVHLKNWKATLIYFILVLIVLVIALFAVHFFVWCFWYPHQLKQWRKDFANAFDEAERSRLIYVRRKMRWYWIPFYFLKRF